MGKKKAATRRPRVAPDARFGLADAAWLRMERPTNHFVVTALMRFDRRLDPQRVIALLEERLMDFERFRQYVEPSRLPLGLPRWRGDRAYDTAQHVRATELPNREGALDDYLAWAVSRPLEPGRPLWEVHVINGPGNRSVLLSRIHHAIGDGMALLNVLMRMTDEGWARGGSRRRQRVPPLAVLAPYLAEAGRLALDRRHRGDRLAYLGAATARLLRLTAMPFDPASPFRGTLAQGKRLAWTRPLPLETARRAGELTGATVNDVVLSCATAAMARYMTSRGLAELPALRATVPYNLRSYERAAGLGNGFTLVYLPLALQASEPLLRLAETSQRMREIKRSPEPVVTNLVLNAIGLLPGPLEGLAVRFFGAKASAVMTNVAGPEHRLHLDGLPIRELRFWEPESASIALGWSVFSYVGDLYVGVIVDAGLVPDPGRLIAGFENEFDELAALAELADRRQRRTRHGSQGSGPRPRAARAAERPQRRREGARPRPGGRAPGREHRGAREHARDQVRGQRRREGADAGAPAGADRDQARARTAAPAADGVGA